MVYQNIISLFQIVQVYSKYRRIDVLMWARDDTWVLKACNLRRIWDEAQQGCLRQDTRLDMRSKISLLKTNNSAQLRTQGMSNSSNYTVFEFQLRQVIVISHYLWDIWAHIIGKCQVISEQWLLVEVFSCNISYPKILKSIAVIY